MAGHNKLVSTDAGMFATRLKYRSLFRRRSILLQKIDGNLASVIPLLVTSTK